MILPSNVPYTGVAGGSFITSITLVESEPDYIWFGLWQPFRTYPINAIVGGSDGNAYVSVVAIGLNDNPVGDSDNWNLLAPIDVTGWTGTCTIMQGTVTASTDLSVGGVEGTFGVNFTGVDTSVFTLGTAVLVIEVYDTVGDNFFPVIGTINFETVAP